MLHFTIWQHRPTGTVSVLRVGRAPNWYSQSNSPKYNRIQFHPFNLVYSNRNTIKCAALSLSKLQCTTIICYLYIGAVNKENDGSHPSNISFSSLLTIYRLDFGFVAYGQLPFTGRPSATKTNNRRICKKNSIIFF